MAKDVPINQDRGVPKFSIKFSIENVIFDIPYHAIMAQIVSVLVIELYNLQCYETVFPTPFFIKIVINTSSIPSIKPMLVKAFDVSQKLYPQ